MLQFLIILVLASPITPYSELRSAATPGQIKFAIENQYDQTGPGANRPETAYKTYKRLEDALIGYLNDNDTKLPEREKAKALYLLYAKSQKPLAITGKLFLEAKSPQHENSIEPTFKPSVLSNEWRLQGVRGNVVLKDHSRWQKVFLTKSNPRSLSHYTREPDIDAELTSFDKLKYEHSALRPYLTEASSPQVSAQIGTAVIHQGPQSDTHILTRANDGSGHSFQGSPDSSNVPSYQRPAHAPHPHSYNGGNAQSFPGSAQAQTGNAQSFYSFKDGEGHRYTIQYRTDHT